MTKAFPVTQRARDLVADILEMSPYGIVRTGGEQVRAGYNDGHAYVLLVARFEAETLKQGSVRNLALAAAALNIATDGMEGLRSERAKVLAALEALLTLGHNEGFDG